MRKKPVKYTAGEIGRLRVTKDFLPLPGALVSKTDWKAAAKMPLPSGRDPDDAMEEIDWATAELPMPRRKAHMTLRLDADMLDWFRKQGRAIRRGSTPSCGSISSSM